LIIANTCLASELFIKADIPEGIAVVIGQGWNTMSGTPIPQRCLDQYATKALPTEEGLSFEEFIDEESFTKNLEVGVNASVKYMGGKVSTAIDFAKKYSYKEKSINISARAYSHTGTSIIPGPESTDTSDNYKIFKESLAKIKLADEFEKLARKNPAKFIQQCGDYFVVSIYKGAEINGYLEFHSLKVEESEELSGGIEFKNPSANVSVDAKKLIKKYTDKKKLVMKFFRLGAQGNPLPTNSQELYTALKQLPVDAVNKHVDLRVLLAPYSYTANGRDIGNNSDMSRYTTLVRYYYRLESIDKTIADILSSDPNSYWMDYDIDIDSLSEAQNEIHEKLDELEKYVEKCTNAEYQDCINEIKKPINIKYTIGDEEMAYYSDYQYRLLLPLSIDDKNNNPVLSSIKTNRKQKNDEISGYNIMLKDQIIACRVNNRHDHQATANCIYKERKHFGDLTRRRTDEIEVQVKRREKYLKSDELKVYYGKLRFKKMIKEPWAKREKRGEHMPFEKIRKYGETISSNLGVVFEFK
jgi:hypothetical protein